MKQTTLILVLLFVSGVLYFSNLPYRYLLEGNASLSSGKVAKAVVLLEEGLKRYPNNNRIMLLLGRAYLLSGETEEANTIVLTKKSLFKNFSKDTTFQDFLLDLSEANKQLGNEKLARTFATWYLECQPEEETSSRVIKNYIRLGQLFPEKSIELWEKAFNIAYAMKKPELKETLKTLLLPKYFQIAEALKNEKKYDSALEILNKVLILGKNAEVNCQLALVYGDLGKTGLAKKYFEEALDLDPTNDSYKISYANYLKKIALGTNDSKKKEEYFEKIKLLLANVEESPRKTGILSKIINFNAKYKITDGRLNITMVDEYFYPSLVFKIKPVSDVVIEKYKVEFTSPTQGVSDTYEAPVTDDELNQLIEVTSRNPAGEGDIIDAKVFLNNEFVIEYSNK